MNAGAVLQAPVDFVSLSPREQARKQLLTLFPYGLAAGEWLELRCMDCSVEPARPGPRHYYRSVSALVEQALLYRAQWDVFFGVGLRRCTAVNDIHSCPHAQKGTDHISRLTAAWGDFDVCSEDESTKPHHSLDELVNMLSNATPSPRLLVGSGTGVHAYWSLGSPTPDLARVASLNRSIRDRFRGDNVVDAARILRVAVVPR